MARVVFLRGVNVGGHRSFRPTPLALALKHLGAVNIGAAGTLVIRGTTTNARIRAEIAGVLPLTSVQYPSRGKWLMKILTRRKRFIIGMYRRHMKVIGYLGRLDRLYGEPVTTRNWNTIAKIAKILEGCPTVGRTPTRRRISLHRGAFPSVRR